MHGTAEDSFPSEQRVLVAIMNNRRDMEIARTVGWYRIPVKRAPRQVAADYLAFYQTAAFPVQRWHINYYTPVLRYRLATRRELVPREGDHPRANNLYYRIDIGPLRRLRRPIPSRKLRRVTFIPTTLEQLLDAEDVTDLWDRSSTAQRLWRELRTGREDLVRDRRVAYRTGRTVPFRGRFTRTIGLFPRFPALRGTRAEFMYSLPLRPRSTL